MFQKIVRKFFRKSIKFVEDLDLEWYFSDGTYVPDEAVVNENEKNKRFNDKKLRKSDLVK